MKILVTGGAGYIGGVAAKHLLDAGHQVAVFDNLELGHKQALDPRAEFILGDLREFAQIRAAMNTARPDAVMHFAAYALVGESSADPGKYFRNNDLGGLNLADAMLECGVKRIVFSSTCATYGQPETMPITEDTPQRPTNPYGQSKLIYEQMLEWYRRIHDFKPVYLRYFNACGAEGALGEDHQIETHIIPNILKVPLGQSPTVKVFGDDYNTPDGTCVRDYIHISDLARAHLLAITSDYCGALNLGTGAGFSVKQIIEAAREVTGHPIPAEIAPRRAGDPDYLVSDPARALRELGWKALITSPREIIADAWDWHRANPEGYAD
ncbi:MAG: UDP-glucose 4-epimerase GalE [Kiritimatiellaeota bacterium]|nr:UDP-glucose 4-epimerase GalE [Kiritimatiellota bacterium]